MNNKRFLLVSVIVSLLIIVSSTITACKNKPTLASSQEYNVYQLEHNYVSIDYDSYLYCKEYEENLDKNNVYSIGETGECLVSDSMGNTADINITITSYSSDEKAAQFVQEAMQSDSSTIEWQENDETEWVVLYYTISQVQVTSSYTPVMDVTILDSELNYIEYADYIWQPCVYSIVTPTIETSGKEYNAICAFQIPKGYDLSNIRICFGNTFNYEEDLASLSVSCINKFSIIQHN